jgi:phosphoenolpyruvate carboxylase
LLDQNPLLARSIKNRFPYLDPLNHVQIELPKRHRAGDTDERGVGNPSDHQRDSRRAAQQWLVPAVHTT